MSSVINTLPRELSLSQIDSLPNYIPFEPGDVLPSDELEKLQIQAKEDGSTIFVFGMILKALEATSLAGVGLLAPEAFTVGNEGFQAVNSKHTIAGALLCGALFLIPSFWREREDAKGIRARLEKDRLARSLTE